MRLAALCLALVFLSPPERPPTWSVAVGGDTMLARLVTETVLHEGPRHVWGDVLPLLRDADFALVNLECCIAAGGEPFQPRRVFYFRAHPKTMECLTLAGIDGVCNANNHALDYGPEALLEMLARLDKAGIGHAGAGKDLAAAAAPAIVERNGLKIGLVAFADHYEVYAATKDRPGTYILPVEPGSVARLKPSIEAARKAGADLVIVTAHWGPNWRVEPQARFVEFARALLDAGADLFWGHSAHIFQRIEFHDGKPILFDTGDLLDDYRVDRTHRNDISFLYRLTVGRRRAWEVDLIPVRIRRMQVNRAEPEDFAFAERRLRRICGDEVSIERVGDRLRVREGRGSRR